MTTTTTTTSQATLMTCRRCGKTLAAKHFGMIRGKYRRHMCNHCLWETVIAPSRRRRIERESNCRQPPAEGADYEDMF